MSATMATQRAQTSNRKVFLFEDFFLCFAQKKLSDGMTIEKTCGERFIMQSVELFFFVSILMIDKCIFA